MSTYCSGPESRKEIKGEILLHRFSSTRTKSMGYAVLSEVHTGQIDWAVDEYGIRRIEKWCLGVGVFHSRAFHN